MDFQYDPLASGSIRLLKPLQNAHNSLSFQIVQISLSSNPRYAALSYTWGPPGDTDHIFVNNHPFPIRENLHDALQQLQDSRLVDKYLWVDAICINQGSDQDALHERSIQITLMKQIYEQAEKVLVWLGKPENDTNNRLAFEKMKYFKKVYLDRAVKTYPYRPLFWPARPRNIGDMVANSLLTTIPAKDHKIFDVPGSSTYKAWLGIVSLWKSPWWTRTWVFQEATVPENDTVLAISGITTLPSFSKVKFLCGDQRTTWNTFLATNLMAINVLATPGLDSGFIAGAMQPFGKLLKFRGRRVQHVQQPFLSILQMFRHSECFDPRDKVYAPLCLAPQDVQDFIRPDYVNKTALEVYTDVVRYCLTLPGHELDFLGFAKYGKEAQTVDSAQNWKAARPSWVPDFAASLDLVPIPKALHVPEASERRRPLNFYNRTIPDLNGQTTAAYCPLGDAPSRAFIENSELHVSGVFIDALKDIIPNTGSDLEKVRTVAREKGRQWAAESDYTYPTGGKWYDAINRTFVLDIVYDYLGRPSERGGRHDYEFLKKPRGELSLTEYRYQMNMSMARDNAATLRNIGFSQKKYSLMIPDTAEVGDAIWALSGGQALYILREANRQLKQYTFIGECYAHGLMDGEIVRMLRVGEVNMEDISLV